MRFFLFYICTDLNQKMEIEKWVDEYGDALYAFALSRISDSEIAKDLVQDTFVAALKNFENFEQRSSVKTWLISILKRKIIDHYRLVDSRKTIAMSHYFRESGRVGHWNENSAPKGIISETVEKIENSELEKTIQDCIENLPEKWKGIVIDKLIEEKDSDEVCKEYEITSSNFWVIIHRAKLQLRACLEINWLK